MFELKKIGNHKKVVNTFENKFYRRSFPIYPRSRAPHWLQNPKPVPSSDTMAPR
jgi:hypothetical protein